MGDSITRYYERAATYMGITGTVTTDGTYIYMAGTYDDGGVWQTYILKFNIADMSLAGCTYINNLNATEVTGLYVDGTYIYAVGRTTEDPNMELVVIHKVTLALVARKKYGDPLFPIQTGQWYDVQVSGGDIYLAGADTYGFGGAGSWVGEVARLDSGFNILAQKYYGAFPGTDMFWNLLVHGGFVYVIGETTDLGVGVGENTFIAKLNAADLSLVADEVYGFNPQAAKDICYSMTSDGTYLYIAGYTTSEANPGGLLLKVRMSDLALIAGKYVWRAGAGLFWGPYGTITIDTIGSRLYLVGYDGVIDNALIFEFDYDLNLLANYEMFGGVADYLGPCQHLGSYLYAAGETYSVGDMSGEGLILKATAQDIPLGNTVPPQWTFTSAYTWTVDNVTGSMLAKTRAWNNSVCTIANSGTGLFACTGALSGSYTILGSTAPVVETLAATDIKL